MVIDIENFPKVSLFIWQFLLLDYVGKFLKADYAYLKAIFSDINL
jgi:hypothetical protein